MSLRNVLSHMFGIDIGGAEVSATNPLPTEGHYKTVTVTIPNGESLSGAVDIGTDTLIAADMPASWTTANLTFQAAPTLDGTYKDVYDGGAEYVFPVVAGKCCDDSAGALVMAPLRYIKVRSGTAGTPVAQAAERTLTLILKR